MNTWDSVRLRRGRLPFCENRWTTRNSFAWCAGRWEHSKRAIAKQESHWRSFRSLSSSVSTSRRHLSINGSNAEGRGQGLAHRLVRPAGQGRPAARRAATRVRGLRPAGRPEESLPEQVEQGWLLCEPPAVLWLRLQRGSPRTEVGWTAVEGARGRGVRVERAFCLRLCAYGSSGDPR